MIRGPENLKIKVTSPLVCWNSTNMNADVEVIDVTLSIRLHSVHLIVLLHESLEKWRRKAHKVTFRHGHIWILDLKKPNRYCRLKNIYCLLVLRYYYCLTSGNTEIFHQSAETINSEKVPFLLVIFLPPLNLWLQWTGFNVVLVSTLILFWWVQMCGQVNVSRWFRDSEATENGELFSDDVRQRGRCWLRARGVRQQRGTFCPHDARASQTEEGACLVRCYSHCRRFLLRFLCLPVIVVWVKLNKTCKTW